MYSKMPTEKYLRGLGGQLMGKFFVMLCFEQKKEKYKKNSTENFQFLQLEKKYVYYMGMSS